jgi:hypothetical protein
MIGDAHAELVDYRREPVDLTTMIIGASLALAALSPVARRTATPSDIAVLAVAAVAVVWIAAGWSAGPTNKDLFVAGSTAVFIILALVMVVALVRTAFGSGRTSDLVFGVLFAFAFLVVRWANVDSLLWSGLLLLASAGGLLAVAQVWRHRDRTIVAQGSAS